MLATLSRPDLAVDTSWCKDETTMLFDIAITRKMKSFTNNIIISAYISNCEEEALACMTSIGQHGRVRKRWDVNNVLCVEKGGPVLLRRFWGVSRCGLRGDDAIGRAISI